MIREVAGDAVLTQVQRRHLAVAAALDIPGLSSLIAELLSPAPPAGGSCLPAVGTAPLPCSASAEQGAQQQQALAQALPAPATEPGLGGFSGLPDLGGLASVAAVGALPPAQLQQLLQQHMAATKAEPPVCT